MCDFPFLEPRISGISSSTSGRNAIAKFGKPQINTIDVYFTDTCSNATTPNLHCKAWLCDLRYLKEKQREIKSMAIDLEIYQDSTQTQELPPKRSLSEKILVSLSKSRILFFPTTTENYILHSATALSI